MAPFHPYRTRFATARRPLGRPAMTLLEIIAVIFIVGIVSLSAATRYSSNTVADVGAQGFARRMALDCSQARRRAIATGDNHLVRFSHSGGNATQYALYRRVGGVATLADSVHTVPRDVTVHTGGATDVEFSFTGEALASYTITVTSANRTRTITVPQVTGRAFVD